MTQTIQDEIKELKEKIAKIENIKYKGLLTGMALDAHRRELRELEKLEELEKDGVQK
jgi:4-aminobutyrate aminotransferase-like enzyme